MATFGDLYQSLYRVSKGPRYEFWHADTVLHKNHDEYHLLVWNTCYTWEEKTCESIMKGLGKTPFIWGLRSMTRKHILSTMSEEDAKMYEEQVPLPYLHGTCPEDVEKYEMKALFNSLFEVGESVFGMLRFSYKKEKEYEEDLVSMYHWLFPYCSMAVRIRDTLRFKAREKFEEMTGETYGAVLPQAWSIDDSWIPFEKRNLFNILYR